MNLDQLRIFITVAECRSFTRAAEQLYISHSTTSRNVSALEESLGVNLLHRDKRSLRLTLAGEILYREGAKLLERVDAVKGAVKNAGRGLSGEISVASVNLYSHSLFNGYKDFCKKFPEVVLGMYHRDISEIWERVQTGEADVGVTFSYTLPDDLSEFVIRPVASERFCIVASVDHPLARQQTVTSDDLLRTGYISLPTVNYNIINKPGEQKRLLLSEEKVSIAPTLESLFLQVRSGNGVSLVPYPIACEYGTSCAILELEDFDTSFDVVLIWRRDNGNPSLPLFIETITRHTEQDYAERIKRHYADNP